MWLIRNDGVIFDKYISFTDTWVGTDEALYFAEIAYNITRYEKTRYAILAFVKTWMAGLSEDDFWVKPAIDYINKTNEPYHLSKRFIYEHLEKLRMIKPAKLPLHSMILNLDHAVKEEFLILY